MHTASWLDHARDLLHLTNTFRAEMPRPLVGIGHSFGASILVALSLLHPRLLSSLVLFDAVVSRFASSPGPFQTGPIAMSAFRRDLWPGGREAARKAFERNRDYYGAWDGRVLDAWLRFGLREAPTRLYPAAAGNGDDDAPPKGAVTLTTTKHQECFTFLRPSWPGYDATGTAIVDRSKVVDLDPVLAAADYPTFPFYRPEGPGVLMQLPHVRPGVLWVFGTRSFVSPERLRREKMETTGVGVGGSGGVAAGKVKQVLMDVGHLIPMERPRECAEHAARWLQEVGLEEWRREEREYEEWKRGSTEDKERLNDEWLKRLRRKGPAPKAKM